jgi:hypothetical protein
MKERRLLACWRDGAVPCVLAPWRRSRSLLAWGPGPRHGREGIVGSSMGCGETVVMRLWLRVALVLA